MGSTRCRILIAKAWNAASQSRVDSDGGPMRHRQLGVLLAALIVVVLIGTAMSGALIGPGMMWGFGPRMMWRYGASPLATGSWALGLGMVVGMLARLAFWGALVVGLVLLVQWARGLSPGGAAPPPPEDPLAILRRRYAAGETDQGTYERMKHELEER